MVTSRTVIIIFKLFVIAGEFVDNQESDQNLPHPNVQFLASVDSDNIQAHGVGAASDSDEIFLSSNFTLVETHRGSDTTLNCRVRRGSDFGTISWFRRSQDGRVVLISVGDDIYLQDKRYSIVRPVLSMNWSLQIRGVKIDDGGEYLCQTSQHPPSSVIVRLAVYQAYADIVGSKEKVFRVGTDVQLVCLIKDVTQPPAFIFWYHNKRMINYDQDEGVSVEVSGISNKSMRSILNMTKVTMSQAGSYTCSPSFARPDTVNITLKHREQALPEPVVNSATTSLILGFDSVFTLLVFFFFQLPSLV